MIALGASLLMLATTAPAAAADVRLEAFQAACLPGHRDPQKRLANLQSEGWAAVPDSDNPMLEATMKLSRQQIEEGRSDGIDGDVAAFRKLSAGKPLYLVVSNVRAEPIALTGCYLFDFGSDRAIAAEAVSAWLKEAPAQTIDHAGLTAQIWNVEGIEGVWDLQNSFIAADSQALSITGYAGTSIKLTSTVETSE